MSRARRKTSAGDLLGSGGLCLHYASACTMPLPAQGKGSQGVVRTAAGVVLIGRVLSAPCNALSDPLAGDRVLGSPPEESPA